MSSMLLQLLLMLLMLPMLDIMLMLDTLRCPLDTVLPLMPVLPMLDILERLFLRLSVSRLIRFLKDQMVLADAVDLPSTTRKAETLVQCWRGGQTFCGIRN